MTQTGEMENLWRSSFSELPRDCGHEADPGKDEVEEWREWHERDTTQDQLRIERVLDRIGIEGKTILHVGAGNSQLAARFSGEATYIVGTTVSVNERSRGEALKLRNYDIRVHNKYSPKPLDCCLQKFDYIVDNNPTSFCCCWRHLTIMMSHYTALLGSDGSLLTDKVGLGWLLSAPGANDRWRFSYADWEAVGRPFGLKASRLDDFVYCLTPLSGRTPGGRFIKLQMKRALRCLRMPVLVRRRSRQEPEQLFYGR